MLKWTDEPMGGGTESCNGCEREWFDLNVQQAETGENPCKDCRKSTPLVHRDNNLYPGPGCPDLPSLTQIEEMLISPYMH